eukprot:gnl/TRDRNA2_/TRDRNA2_177310_c3_seq2.p1 gnl/TRDRNA2_/TRDRNA2_177310_c3~~gnl/TRDRNA2_/TRDRNA2_177310_c3_seq2.p1  ORF type:complete len:113 (+),score=2.70 gnl/TRDRNA2_/TRDRNA2_177310_c3_seq2:17-355(+)
MHMLAFTFMLANECWRSSCRSAACVHISNHSRSSLLIMLLMYMAKFLFQLWCAESLELAKVAIFQDTRVSASEVGMRRNPQCLHSSSAELRMRARVAVWEATFFHDKQTIFA